MDGRPILSDQWNQCLNGVQWDRPTTLFPTCICWSEGMKSEPSSQGGMNVYPTRDGAYIQVKGVDFGAQGPGSFFASVAGQPKDGLKGGAIELRLDRIDGPLIGTLPVGDTGGEWKTEAIPVSGATGTRELFFVFRNSPHASVFKFDHWKFDPKAAPPRAISPTAAPNGILNSQ